MASSALEEIQQDSLALSVARALALANETATAEGFDQARFLVTITEETSPPNRRWRIHYGPRDYTRRRGGDLMVVVNEQAGAVERIVRGQ